VNGRKRGEAKDPGELRDEGREKRLEKTRDQIFNGFGKIVLSK